MKILKLIALNLVIIIFFTITSPCNIVFSKEKKTVYLTFDDGPSNPNTTQILNILNKNGVKGTFFVVGSRINKNKEVLKRAKNLGMAIYPHCYKHTYNEIYKSKKDYFKDLKACQNKIKGVTNRETKENFVRMPGGSTNTVGKKKVINEIKKELVNKKIMYIDWNVDSGDASSTNVSSEFIKKNFKRNGGIYKVEVVLMHDGGGKKSTVDSLEKIINEYKLMGYEFKTLDNITKEEIDYLKKIRVINNK